MSKVIKEPWAEIDMRDIEMRVAGTYTARLYDRHIMRAAAHFNIEPSQVTPEQRRVGKSLNWFELYSGPSSWLK